MNSTPLSKEAILEGLKALGLKRGDIVFMHSNLRALGTVREIIAAPDGGMKWLIEAFREVLGPEGILAVPTFTATFKPGQPGPAGHVWHPDKTRSRVGQITNYILSLPDRKRSDHPTHSVAAIGDRAEEFCKGHSWREGASTFDRNGPGSAEPRPLHRLPLVRSGLPLRRDTDGPRRQGGYQVRFVHRAAGGGGGAGLRGCLPHRGPAVPPDRRGARREAPRRRRQTRR